MVIEGRNTRKLGNLLEAATPQNPIVLKNIFDSMFTKMQKQANGKLGHSPE